MRSIYSISAFELDRILNEDPKPIEMIFMVEDDKMSICPVQDKNQMDLKRCFQLTPINKED